MTTVRCNDDSQVQQRVQQRHATISSNLPVFEANITVLTSSCVDANTKYHEADDSDYLDGTEPEFHFTVEVDR